MTVHAPSDITAITIPAERGGCGEPHELGEPTAGVPRTLDCAACEPHIIASRTGWAHDPIAVALTCDEIAQVEAAERTARVEQNKTWTNPSALRNALFGDQPAQAPSLFAQIAALSQEERSALAAMLGAGTPPSVEAPTVTDPEPVAATPSARKSAKKTAPPPAAK